MHARFSFHHSNLQLAYTTQVWILKFKTCAMQAKHMKCTFKCTIQVHELAPPTYVLKILSDSFPLSYLCPYVKYSPYHLYLYFSPLWCLFTIFVHYFSPFVINDHKGLKSRQVRFINVNQLGENHIPKIWFKLDYFPKIFNSV